MNDHAVPAFSRVCPECGRRVPSKVPSCRCGCVLDELAETPGVAPAETAGADEHLTERRARRGASSLITTLVVAAAASLTVFLWMRQAPPAGAGVAITPTYLPAPPPRPEAATDSPSASKPSFTILPNGDDGPPPLVVEKDAAAAPATVALPLSLEDVVSRAMPALVRVESPEGFGSGFFIAPETIVTNAHVVGSHSSVTIRRTDGRTTPARVETSAPEFDIAIMRIGNPDPHQATLTMGSGVNARAGQEIIALGTPLGLQNTVTRGIVSAVREVGGVTLVQTDAAINPGNSGGPLLDRAGAVIAIATMRIGSATAQGLSFGVAIEHVNSLLAGRRSAGTGTPAASLTQAMSGRQETAASDAIRDEGARTYEQAIAALARTADSLDEYWRNFKSSCYEGRVAGSSFDREWFALWDQRAMQGAVSPGCEQSFANIRGAARNVRTGVLNAQEAARRAGVYPGTIRDVRRRHRLEYPD
jgi:S1-C subfamily serine protease